MLLFYKGQIVDLFTREIFERFWQCSVHLQKYFPMKITTPLAGKAEFVQ